MRKSFVLLAAATVAFASCVKSEVVEIAQDRVINFEPFVENQTKAIHDITDGSADFAEFYVFGAKGTQNTNGVFEAETDSNDEYYLHHVKVSGGAGKWSYSPHVPWIVGKTFRFAAYANGTGNGTATDAKLDDSIVTFVPEEEIVNGSETAHLWGLDLNDYVVSDRDLIVAAPEEKSVTDISNIPTSVGMTFKHVLAKVIFQFRYTANTNEDDLVLEILPFQFKAYKKGDCKLRYTGVNANTMIGANWTPSYVNNEGDYYGFFEQIDSENQSWESGNIQSESYVIPQSNSSITIPEITIISKKENGEETDRKTFTNVSLNIPNHTTWLPGYVYRYVADITPGAHYIHFTTNVTSWIDEDDRNQAITSGTAPTPGV